MDFERVSFEEFKRSLEACDCQMPDEMAYDAWEGIKIPERATERSAGYDIRMPFDVLALAGVKYMIPTGLKIDMDPNCSLQIYPRSSLGFKYGLTLSNTIPIIDADYYGNESNEGHILLSFKTDRDLFLEAGDRIVQGGISEYRTTDSDNAKGTRTGGIGSTGV